MLSYVILCTYILVVKRDVCASCPIPLNECKSGTRAKISSEIRMVHNNKILYNHIFIYNTRLIEFEKKYTPFAISNYLRTDIGYW